MPVITDLCYKYVHTKHPHNITARAVPGCTSSSLQRSYCHEREILLLPLFTMQRVSTATLTTQHHLWTVPGATTAPAAVASSCTERDSDRRACSERCSSTPPQLQRALTTYTTTPPVHRPLLFTDDATPDPLMEIRKPEESHPQHVLVMTNQWSIHREPERATAPQQAALVTGINASSNNGAGSSCLVVGLEFPLIKQ